MNSKLLLLIGFLLCLFSCKNVPDAKVYTQTQPNISAKTFFHQTEKTLVSAHRGGSGIKGFPENAIETLDFLYQQGINVFEIDVFQTEDKEIMLLHDNHLERTTNGNGSLNRKTAKQLLQYNLVDDFGTETSFKIPFLHQALDWAKNKNAFLMIDFKKSAKYEDVIELIRSKNMQDQVVLISYSVGQAKKQNRLAPEMMISVSARNEKELDWILETEIPVEQMIAFTGTQLSRPELYNRLNELKIPVILGTLGNLDRRAEARGNEMYKKWADLGIQIIATDRAIEAYNALK
ncbi:MAG: glycerophosphodiester phosphodiesterase family protein [Flavobacteriaceae bacterium]|nr:glycerophosphodiester phosphodiesterase family protein [Flavobacteriaceae bacterium]